MLGMQTRATRARSLARYNELLDLEVEGERNLTFQEEEELAELKTRNRNGEFAPIDDDSDREFQSEPDTDSEGEGDGEPRMVPAIGRVVGDRETQGAENPTEAQNAPEPHRPVAQLLRDREAEIERMKEMYERQQGAFRRLAADRDTLMGELAESRANSRAVSPNPILADGNANNNAGNNERGRGRPRVHPRPTPEGPVAHTSGLPEQESMEETNLSAATLLKELVKEMRTANPQRGDGRSLNEPARIPLKPDYYDGKSSWYNYTSHFKCVGTTANWPVNQWGTILGAYMVKGASAGYEKIPQVAKEDWTQFKHLMSIELGESSYASQGKLLLHVYDMNTDLMEAAQKMDTECRAASIKSVFMS